MPTIIKTYGASRVAIGAAMALAPAAAAPWLGPVAEQADAKSALRVLGVRDALLGVAVLVTSDVPKALRRCLLICAVADAADTLMSVDDYRRTRRAGAAFCAVTAAAAATTGLLTSRSLRGVS